MANRTGAVAVDGSAAPPQPGSARPVLRVEGVSKSFGRLKAVDRCFLEVGQGEIVGLIGPNGAGKTTLFNIVSGFERPDEGRVWLRGQDITPLKPYQRSRLGLGRTFQITRLFPRMTVWENLLVAAPDSARAPRRAAQLLELVGLAAKRDEYARHLSYGQQKLLELARILMRDPVLVLLDEPAAGIHPNLLQQVLALVRRLREEQGTSFLVVEHNMDVVMGHCDRVVVMSAGQVIAQGPPAQVQQDERVLEAYFGRPQPGRGLWAEPAADQAGQRAGEGAGA
ncbi:MAG TPA: ABC transporter ATP-binding protein [Limnochordales bacterium]